MANEPNEDYDRAKSEIVAITKLMAAAGQSAEFIIGWHESTIADLISRIRTDDNLSDTQWSMERMLEDTKRLLLNASGK